MAAANQGLKQNQQLQMRLNVRQMLLGRLLEMSTPEFEEEIVRAMEENPALTTIDAAEDSGQDSSSVTVKDDDDDVYANDDFEESRPRGSGSMAHFASVSSEAELIEQQLSDLSLNDVEREIAGYIIGNLDSSGYLTRSADAIVDDMAMTDGIFVAKPTVEKIIKLIKTLDPAGIGAENLRECLLIQLARMPETPTVEVACKILDKHYKAFVNNRLDSVRDSLGVDDALINAALKLIKSLNPKPGAGLFDHDSDDRSRHITPDFYIEVDDNDNVMVSLAGQIPELTVEPSFRVPSESIRDPKSLEFIKERHDGAVEFINAVNRRSTTLLAIMKAIVRLQPAFFRTFEPQDLKPMVIRDIEELTGLDKSVISRATSSKYMLTPDGMYALKSLFGESASSVSEIAPREVEAMMKEIVGGEDKSHPFSDDELADILSSRGMPVARRTVAKYRERIGIPIARLRRS